MSRTDFVGEAPSRRRLSRLAIAILGVVAAASLLGAASASAADLTVNDDTMGTGPAGADCAAPAYSAIQPAIDDANPGDRVLVCEGTYQGQLTVDKAVSLVGAGAGSVIESPASAALVSQYTLAGFQYQPVVYVAADDVTIRDLKVDGVAQGNVNGNFLFTGISGVNRDGLEIRDNQITRIQKTPFDGVQTGFAIRLDNTDSASRSAVIDGNTLTQYQKGGIVIRGVGLDGTVTDNVITGVGPQTDIAQNGISFGRGMSGLIEGNQITDNQCNQASCGPDPTSNAQSAGLIMVASGATGGDVIVRDNEFERNDTGVLSSVSDGSLRTVDANTFTDNRYIGLYTEDGEMEATGNTITGGNSGVVALSGAGGFVPELHLLGNTITQAGRGVQLIQVGGGANPAPQVTADHNRIVGNATAGIDNGSTDTVAAENNWWGCNEGPTQPGCDGVIGSVDYDPWLVLDIAANPTSLVVGQNSQITATLLRNSDGLSAGTGFPDQTPIAFATDLGAVTPASAMTSAGEASTVLSSNSPGDATVQASLDSETVATNPSVTFAPPNYTLTVTKRGAGSGTVSSSPAGIDCGATCSHDYAKGIQVQLSAAADPGSTFTGFTNGNCAGQQTCTVKMSRARSVDATFVPDYTLTVTKPGAGSGTVSSSPAGIDCGATCSHQYVNGTEVELSATADPGSTFVGFTNSDCARQQTCTVKMGRARNVVATFKPNYTLTVTKPGAGTGTVSSSPAGIDCGATCSHEYANGTQVQLSATADPGSTFAGFTGAHCAGQQTCTVAMSRARNVVATFTSNPPPD
jgi:hypothetical protein